MKTVRMIRSDESSAPIEIYVQWALSFVLLKTFHYPTLCVIFRSVRKGPPSVRYFERTPPPNFCVWLSNLCVADPELCVCAFMGTLHYQTFVCDFQIFHVIFTCCTVKFNIVVWFVDPDLTMVDHPWLRREKGVINCTALLHTYANCE